MLRHFSYLERSALPLLLLFAMHVSAADDPVVFKSDVALTRVDAKVVDQQGRAITGLEINDFVLRLDGRVLPIRNFASENMPIDILLLLDVSGSMEPHIQRIASAAQQALNVLADKDRVAIMVFDTSTRVRLPFRNEHAEVVVELDRLLRSERFNGGTHITYALLQAARYMQREARKDARRAIVILTDDETQDEENEARVESALAGANTVLSFLQAPYDPPQMNRGGRRRGTWGSGGGGWPGGGGIGFPGSGPVILGRRGPGGYGGGDMSHSAGTVEIARDSGGDTIQVDEASALEDTLAKLRQRYALYFYVPEASKGADQGIVKIDLSQEARLRYQDAEIHSRRVHMSGTDSDERSEPTVVTSAHRAVDTTSEPAPPDDQPTPKRGSVAVNEDSEPRVNTIDVDSDSSRQEAAPRAAAKNPPPAAKQAPASGGWPRANQSTSPQ